MHSIPLPPFTFMLWGGAAAVFIISVLILLVAKPDEEGHASPLSALVPFAIPAGVSALAVLIVSGIGALLLLVGKEIAVPLALVLALVVLVVCGYVSSRPSQAAQ